MNEKQRTRLAAIQSQLSKLAVEVEGIRDENQDAYDNMPEGLQSGEKGDALNEAIERLNDVVITLEDAGSNLSEF